MKETNIEVLSHAGEGGWSLEALSRAKKVKFELYDTRTKQTRPLIGVDAIDVFPQPHEIKFQIDITGKRIILDKGSKCKGE